MDKRDAIDVTLGIAAGVGVATGIAGVCVGATALKQTKRLQLQVSSHNSRIEELEAAAVATANEVATATHADISFDCVGDIYERKARMDRVTRIWHPPWQTSRAAWMHSSIPLRNRVASTHAAGIKWGYPAAPPAPEPLEEEKLWHI